MQPKEREKRQPPTQWIHKTICWLVLVCIGFGFAACAAAPAESVLPQSSFSSSLALSFSSAPSSAWSFEHGTQRIAIEGCAEVFNISSVQLANNIIGTIGDTLYVLEEKNEKVTVTALDDETFEEKGRIELSGQLWYRYYLKSGFLRLRFKDRVVTLNSDLSIQKEVPLPKTLLDLGAQPDDWDYGWGVFGGYDVNDDYTLWVYISFSKVFLYSTVTEATTQLQLTSPPNKDGDTADNFPHTNPRFSSDNKTIYTKQNIMDFMSDAVCAFDVTSGKGKFIAEASGGDRTGFISKANANMGSYFGHIEYEYGGLYPTPSLFLSLAENYYLCCKMNDDYPIVNYFLVGRLDDPNLDHAKKIPPGEGRINVFETVALADGRILFAVNTSSDVYAPQVFVTQPYSAL